MDVEDSTQRYLTEVAQVRGSSHNPVHVKGKRRVMAVLDDPVEEARDISLAGVSNWRSCTQESVRPEKGDRPRSVSGVDMFFEGGVVRGGGGGNWG